MITNSHDLVIASGQSLSNTAILRNTETVIAIEIPSDWTTAPLTLLASNGSTPKMVVHNGSEFSASGASSFNVIDPVILLGAKSVQVRSGTSGTPVNQVGNKTIVLITGELG